MTEMNKIGLKEFLILCIFYLILVIGTGFYRVNLMTNILEGDILQFAKLSGTISMVLTSLFSVIRVFIISFICKLTIDIFSFSLSIANLIQGLVYSVLTLIFFETLRFFNAYIYLEESITHIEGQDNLIEEIMKTKWYSIDSILIEVMIIASFSFFSIGLGKGIKMNKRRFFEIILIGIIFLLGFYLSTLKFF